MKKQTICPNCGHKQAFDPNFKILTCEKCLHQWIITDKWTKKEIADMAWGIGSILIFLCAWIGVSELIFRKSHLPMMQSYISGLIVILILLAFTEVIIQSLTKKDNF